MVHRHAIFQARDSREKATAFVGAWSSRHRKYGPQFRRPAGAGASLDVKLKTRRHHADHGVLFVVECDGLAHHTGLTTKATLPQSIAEHSNRRFAFFSIVGQEGATKHWIDAEHFEKFGRCHLHGQVFGFAGAGEIETKICECGDLLVTGGLFAPAAKVSSCSTVLVSSFGSHFP